MFNLFKKKNKATDSNHQYVEIYDIRRETEDTVSIVFNDPDRELKYTPGQFLTLILDIDGKEERRSYSLCSSPHSEEYPTVTIKRVSDGLVSNHINDHLKPGDKIKVMPPLGNFTTTIDSKNARHLVFFGAGSGITPLMAILKSALIIEPNSRVSLIYGNRTEDAIIFKKELDDLQQEHGSRMQVTHILSQPGNDWNGYTGRINSDMINKILEEHQVNPEKDEFFLCGPSGFMHTIIDTITASGAGTQQIHKESFVSDKDPQDASGDEYQERNVTILLDGEEYQVTVPANKTILESGLDDNIDMPFSCQSGLCTACRGRLVSGKVQMEEDDGLSDEEIDMGYVLCCVGHPMSDDVKIEIG